MKMSNKNIVKSLLCLVLPSLLGACGSFPKEAETVAVDTLSIYPEYKDLVIPCNIAPMNFMVDNQAKQCAVRLTGKDGKTIEVVSDDDLKVRFPKKQWKEMLASNVSEKIQVEVFLKTDKWYRYPSYSWEVSADSIDPYLTCRLIEPLYNATGKIGLVQFDLEESEMKVLADNKRFMQDPTHQGPKCVNCHIKQRNNSGNSLFFCREKGGGMVLTYNGKTRIVDTKVGDMRVSAVFSTWHPKLPYIAFSNNKVMQLFMSQSLSKIEPLDYYSDLLMYDVERNEVSYICKTPNKMETNPYWSPDGKYVYFCSSDSVLDMNVELYQRMKYDLMRVEFHEDSLTWGEPEMVYSATKMGKSVSKPKVSPDGRYVMFTVSEFSGYQYTHDDTDIYLYDLSDNTCRCMTEINSDRTEAITDWSSNGRWFLVSSRVDGTYARLFFSHFDADGKATKRFQMPHEDPAWDREMTKNYNAPEFGTFDVPMSSNQLYDLVDEDNVLKANYRGTMEYAPDGTTGASIVKQ